MKQFLLLPAILFGFQASSLAQTLTPGTDIEVRADTPVYVSPMDRGRMYPGHVAHDVYNSDGQLVIARGDRADLVVRQTGPDQLVLSVADVNINGDRYNVYSSGPYFNLPRDAYDDPGQMLSSVMSYISAEPGTRVNVEARGQQVRVPEGAIIRFQLQDPVRIGYPDYNSNSGYRNPYEYNSYQYDRNPYR